MIQLSAIIKAVKFIVLLPYRIVKFVFYMIGCMLFGNEPEPEEQDPLADAYFYYADVDENGRSYIEMWPAYISAETDDMFFDVVRDFVGTSFAPYSVVIKIRELSKGGFPSIYHALLSSYGIDRSFLSEDGEKIIILTQNRLTQVFKMLASRSVSSVCFDIAAFKPLPAANSFDEADKLFLSGGYALYMDYGKQPDGMVLSIDDGEVSLDDMLCKLEHCCGEYGRRLLHQSVIDDETAKQQRS